MKWALYVLGAVAGVAVIIFGIGMLLPAQHSFSRSVIITQPPEVVWKTLSDFAGQSSWRPDFRSAERLPNRDQKEVWKVTDTQGRSMTMEVMELVPPQRLVEHYFVEPASGEVTWTFEIIPVPGGCRVRLTEDDYFSKPLLRFVTFVAFGTRLADDFLKDLAKKFHDPQVVE